MLEGEKLPARSRHWRVIESSGDQLSCHADQVRAGAPLAQITIVDHGRFVTEAMGCNPPATIADLERYWAASGKEAAGLEDAAIDAIMTNSFDDVFDLVEKESIGAYIAPAAAVQATSICDLLSVLRPPDWSIPVHERHTAPPLLSIDAWEPYASLCLDSTEKEKAKAKQLQKERLRQKEEEAHKAWMESNGPHLDVNRDVASAVHAKLRGHIIHTLLLQCRGQVDLGIDGTATRAECERRGALLVTWGSRSHRQTMMIFSLRWLNLTDPQIDHPSHATFNRVVRMMIRRLGRLPGETCTPDLPELGREASSTQVSLRSFHAHIDDICNATIDMERREQEKQRAQAKQRTVTVHVRDETAAH